MREEDLIIPQSEINDFLETLIRESKDGIIVIDLKGVVLFANPSAETIFAFQTESLIGHPFGVPALDKRFEFCLLDGKHTILEIRVSQVAFMGESAYLLMVRDTTERVKVERDHKELTQLLLDTGEVARVGGWRVDLKTEHVWWSEVCREIHGTDAGFDPDLNDVYSFYPEESREILAEAIGKSAKDGTPYDLELPFVTAKGERLWVHIIGHPVFEEDRIVALKGTLQDITQQHQLHEQLLEREFHFRKLFEHAIQGFALAEMIFDEQGEPRDYKIIDVNQAFTDILGITHKQAINKTVLELIPEIVESSIWDVFRQVAKTGTPQRMEFFSEFFDRHFLVSIYRPGKDQLGIIFSDITERVNATSALQKSEKKYRQMFENMINGFALHEIILDENGKPVNFRFLDANAAFESHTGIKPEDAIGKLGTEVLPGIERTDLIELYGQVALTGGSQQFEIHYEPLDRHYLITAFSPEPNQFATVFLDISKRIKTGLALQKSESRYRLLFENAFSGFILVEMITDEQGRPIDFVYLEMNATFEEQIGLKAKDVLGKRASEVSPPILQTNLLENLGNVSQTSHSQQYELFLPGYDRYFLVSSYSPFEGQVASITADLTDQMKAERQMRQSEKKYRTLFEAMSQGVVYHDAEGKVISVNPAAENILGVSAQYLMGKSPVGSDFKAFRMNGDPMPADQHPALVALRTGDKIENFVFGVFNRKRKEKIWLDVSAIPLFHVGQDEPYQVFTTFLEITDQIRIQQALEERIKELRCLSRVSSIMQEKQSLDEICSLIVKEIVQGMQYPDLAQVEVQLAGKVFNSTDDYKETPRKLRVPIRFQEKDLGRITVCLREDELFLLPEELNLLEGIAERLAIWYHQNQTQARLEESERRLRNAIMNAPNPIMIHTEDGEVIEVNDAWLEGSGYPREEIGTTMQWMKLAHPDQFKKLQNTVKDNFKAETVTSDGDYAVHTKSGEIRQWSFNTASLGNMPDGRLLVITLANDITNRVLAEKEKDQYLSRIIALREIDRMMVSTLDLDQVLDTITSHMGNLILFDSMSVILHDEGVIKIIACKGFNQPEDILDLQFPPDPGYPNYEIIKSGKPFAVTDISKAYPKFTQPGPPYLPGDIKSWLGVPLVNQNKVIGMFAIDRLNEKPFTEEDIEIAMEYGNRAAIALTNAQLYEQIKSQIERLEILRKIDGTITTSVDLSKALETILVQVRKGLGVDIASVFLYNETDQTLNYAQSVGFTTKGQPNIKVNLGQGYIGSIAATKEPLFVPEIDLTDDGRKYPFSLKEEGIVSYYGYPLISKGKLQGVLQIMHRERLEPDADWVEFAETLARQTAIAVDNLTLFKDLETTNRELREAYDATIEGWAHALEIRDKETEGHSRRVVEFTVAVATAFGVDPDKMVHIRRGVLLHDIGKMGIPDQILHKPGPLNEDEWVIMRQHPKFAFEMLSSIDYLAPALIIPHYHHERWDGSGYPEGLKGEGIPLEARIFAVADVWDALTSDRPYRKAWSKEKTKEYLRAQSGKEFDPEVVKVFLKIIKQ